MTLTGLPAGPSEQETLEILGRARAGEHGAWDELYRRHHDALLFAVRARLGPELRGHLQSADIFQSVALESLRALEDFEYRGPGSLMRFLQHLVTNKIRDRVDTFRAAKRAGTRPLDEALVVDVEPAYEDPETYERLERGMSRLAPELRQVLLLRKVEGLCSKEVAARLGRSDDVIRKAYSRAVARLAVFMANPDSPDSPG